MQTDRILIVGPSGCGKTALMSGNHPKTKGRSILGKFKEKAEYVFVADPHQKYQNTERFSDAGIFIRRFREGLNPGVYAFTFESELDWEVAFDIVREFVKTDVCECAFIVDELLSVSDARSSSEPFRWFFAYARNYRCHLAYNSMRPINVDGLLRGNLSAVIAFRQAHDDDIEALREIGFIGDRAFELKNLKQFEYREFRESDIFKKVKETKPDADTDSREETEDETGDGNGNLEPDNQKRLGFDGKKRGDSLEKLPDTGVAPDNG